VHNKQTPIRQADAVGLFHSTVWWSDYSCFIFVRYSLQISDVRPARVTVFHGFAQCLHKIPADSFEFVLPPAPHVTLYTNRSYTA
jgi:hypothetical protein